ncbi:MAG: DUF2339 domain-containing protein [Bacteroidota bacterium]
MESHEHRRHHREHSDSSRYGYYHSGSYFSRSHKHSSKYSKKKQKEAPISSSKHRLEDLPKLKARKRLELFFIRNILTFFGVIFIIGAIWFGFNTWQSNSNDSTNLIPGNSELLQTLTNVFFSFTEKADSHRILVSTDYSPGFITVFKGILACIIILVLIVISVRLKIITLRFLSFILYVILSFWLLFNLISQSTFLAFYVFISITFLFYFLFFLSGFADTYVGRSKWKYALEYLLILANCFLYIIENLLVLGQYDYKFFTFGIILLLTIINIAIYYYAKIRSVTYNTTPFHITTIFIASAIIPMLVHINTMLVYIAVLSVFASIYAKTMRNRAALNISMISLAILIFAYVQQWVSEYIPLILDSNPVFDYDMFYHSLVAGIAVLATVYIFHALITVENQSTHFKWLKTFNIRRNLKATLLILFYLGGYWAFYYLFCNFWIKQRIHLFDWYTYNCIYFIVVMQVLKRQRSSFLRLVVVFATLTTIFYPTYIYLKVFHYFEEGLIIGKGTSLVPYYFHYACLAALIYLLLQLLTNFKHAFPRKKALIKAFWIYLYLITTFILLTEYDHISLLIYNKSATMFSEMIFANKQLPYSLIIISSAILTLIIGFIIKSRFLRIFSIIMIGLGFIKILVYDIIYLNNLTRTILLAIVGILVLSFSVTYSSNRRSSSSFQRHSSRNRSSSSGKRSHSSRKPENDPGEEEESKEDLTHS